MNIIMSQYPIGGTRASAIGSPVDLVVSSGRPTVPGVVGWSEADANAAIIAAGLTIGTVAYEYNDTVEAGYVISQNPPREQ
ncbi:MAG: PASTA domain-containing protein [Planctomycetota bacterium]|jgi:serine/threonine-protein kinase